MTLQKSSGSLSEKIWVSGTFISRMMNSINMLDNMDGLAAGQRVAAGGVAFLLDGDVVRTEKS